MGKKRKLKSTGDDENEFCPIPKHHVLARLNTHEKRLIIILEGAQLESVKVSMFVTCILGKRIYCFVI